MNKNIQLLLGVFFSLSLMVACDSNSEDPNNTPTKRYVNYNHKTKTGKVITYFKDGEKKTVGYYKNGQRDSLYRSWYINGKPELEIWYNNGKKDGMYKYYRYEGPIYREIEYKDDLKNGLYQEFWSNGNIKYSIEYDKGLQLDETLVEFKQNGYKQKGKFLVLQEINNVRKNGQYKVLVFFEDLPKRATYLVWVDDVPYVLENKNGKGEFMVEVPNGAYIMKKVKFEGYYEGRKSTLKSVKRNFNIGVDNL